MPLHLLGKKSWNVYNADNIARVQRDEAAAQAAEEAEEQRMQEIDAQRRLAILRGEVPPPLEDKRATKISEASFRPSGDALTGSFGRKRKRQGEDDTDFELRVAKERNELTPVTIEKERKPSSSAPIVDHNGHIDLFGDERSRAHAEKNEEAEKESKKKKQNFEDQYTMRFANAAGKDGTTKPWYSQPDAEAPALPLKNAFGRDDPQRRVRDTQRIAANDPLAMMKQGAAKVRELKQERKKAEQEREEDLRQLRRDERRREKRRGGEERSSSRREEHGGELKRMTEEYEMENYGRGGTLGRQVTKTEIEDGDIAIEPEIRKSGSRIDTHLPLLHLAGSCNARLDHIVISVMKEEGKHSSPPRQWNS
ncbi:hypothetical protein G7046_g9358 [Stylonectria norvegica]|nr:hypothetical protein G7046_g9358 [Stylonectria norvegica]